jgi:hypothetical protein
MVISQGCQPWYVQLPGGVHVVRASRDEVLISREISHQNDPMIPPKVYQMWWNNNVIAAKVHPLTRRSPNSIDDTTMISNNDVTHFWIIDIFRNKSFGPLSEEGFFKQMNSLGVDSLHVKFGGLPFTHKGN